MRKQVKLTKRAVEKPKPHSGIFGAEDCSGGAFKAVVGLKIFEMILVTIFGLFLGIFAPLSIFMGTDDALNEAIFAGAAWIASSALYLVGFFVLMLGKSKIALIIHLCAAVGTFVTYSFYQKLFAEIPDYAGPSVLYMPSLFITLLTLAITLVIHVPRWVEQREKRLNEKAPSILDDDNK